MVSEPAGPGKGYSRVATACMSVCLSVCPRPWQASREPYVPSFCCSAVLCAALCLSCWPHPSRHGLTVPPMQIDKLKSSELRRRRRCPCSLPSLLLWLVCLSLSLSDCAAQCSGVVALSGLPPPLLCLYARLSPPPPTKHIPCDEGGQSCDLSASEGPGFVPTRQCHDFGLSGLGAGRVVHSFLFPKVTIASNAASYTPRLSACRHVFLL